MASDQMGTFIPRSPKEGDSNELLRYLAIQMLMAAGASDPAFFTDPGKVIGVVGAARSFLHEIDVPPAGTP